MIKYKNMKPILASSPCNFGTILRSNRCVLRQQGLVTRSCAESFLQVARGGAISKEKGIRFKP
jgi:hypothetical protein